MKLLVPVKRVLDHNVKVRVKTDQTGVDLANAKMSMNPFDEIAVEEAVRLKEKGLATDILVVSIGPVQAQDTIRTALAMGADRGLLIQTDQDLEPPAVAKLLKALVDEESPDLVLMGKQAIDGDNNAVDQMLAALMGRPQVTFASQIEIANRVATVTREVDGGLQTISVDLPAVITADLRLNEPRFASLPNVVLGKDAQGAAEAAKISGIRKVWLVQSEALGQSIVEAEEAALLPILGGYNAVLSPSTSAGKNLIPRLAAKLDLAPISDVVEVIDAATFVRPIYAGNALETVRTADTKVLATIRPTVFAAAPDGGSAAIEILDSGADSATSRFVSANQVKSGRPELGSAKIVISGGRALGSKEEFKAVLEPLADKLGAAIGASRAAVDSGYAPNDYQVGQTGKVVAPNLYIAIGISGAIQHLTGIKDAKAIMAINKDSEAAIFQVADYGLVGDYKTLVPDLMAALAAEVAAS